MKYFILIIFLCVTFLSHSQTYSKVISDDEIVNFINFDIERDSIKGIKTIRKKIFTLYKDIFYYNDSADYDHKNNNNWQFIFRRHIYQGREITYHLDTVFSREDINFFLKQIRGIKKRETWKKEFINSTLVDNVEMDADNHVKTIMYSYSIPLFSADKKKAIIIKGFFCGLVCGGDGYYIYKKTDNNEWILLTIVNEWAE